MRKIKKKSLFIMLFVAILVGINFPQSAYAIWEKDNYDWKYIGDYGYEKGWKQIDGRWYYFTPDTGVMKLGWFYDEEYKKWYYLNTDGYMDSSKTTQSYPVELQEISNKIKQYVGEEISYQGTSNVDGNIFASFISDSNVIPRKYYYHLSTGNVYEVKDGMLNNLATHDVLNIFTKEQAVDLVKDYLSKNNEYIPGVIKVESDEGDSYLVHCYDDMGGYTSANCWYYVNKDTREIKSMM
ncbi:cell wall-binding protein [Clostridium sp.]|uniref:cell wall-binding protein n=1 Tax=Clostridium sp. TaxID=1506 RepID=UPI0026027640|nr:cell wall-binding protein [Clostridium sp.]